MKYSLGDGNKGYSQKTQFLYKNKEFPLQGRGLLKEAESGLCAGHRTAAVPQPL